MFDKIRKFFSKKSFYTEEYRAGAPVWSIQNDESYVEEAFEKIVWCYSCVIAIASAVGSIPWRLYKRQGADLKEIKSHYLLDMFNGDINADFTAAEFFELWAVCLATQGKFFAFKDNPVLPSELRPMYAHKVKPIPGAGQNTLSGFDYELNNLTYSPNLILWDRFIDPLDFYQGLSPIRAGARTMDTENQSVDWNKNVFDNIGIPPGAISLYNVSPAQIEEAKKRWLSDYSGPKKARMPLIFDSEKINYINFGFSQVDMDFIMQKKVNRIEICSTFGVPGQVVGDPEGQTYANFGEALKAFWSQTVIPRYLNRIAARLNKDIVRLYDKAFIIKPDLSDISVLQEDETSKTDRIRGLFIDNLITQNEAREAVGWTARPDGDVYNYQLVANLADSLIDEEAPADEDGAEDDN